LGYIGSIAHAGMKGNTEAKIRALNMHAVQLRIADCYSRRPDGTNIPYIVKSSTCTPEEARIVDNNIVLYKINS
jgi:septum formation inhibitor MinC